MDGTVLSMKHEMLKENHETLQKDYECLEERFKQVLELNDLMKFIHQKQSKELEEKNLSLLEELERERSENEKLNKKIEEIERMENELRIKDQELLIAKEEELKKIVNQYVELTEKFAEIAKECSDMKSRFEEEAKNPIGQEKNIVVDHDVNKNVTEKIDEGETKCSDSKSRYDDNAEKNNEVIDLEDYIVNNTVKKSLRYDDEVMFVKEYNAKKTSKDAVMISDDDSDVELPVKRPRYDFNKTS